MFWTQLGLLALALLLGTLIGAEREYEGKPAGMRTHALIALDSASFVLTSKYGFGISHGLHRRHAAHRGGCHGTAFDRGAGTDSIGESHRPHRAPQWTAALDYDSGSVLARVLALCTNRGFSVTEISTEHSPEGNGSTTLALRERGSMSGLTALLSQEPGVTAVSVDEA